MNISGPCYKCHRISIVKHPFDKDSFICAKHYNDLRQSFPISKIPNISELNLPGDGLTDHILINKYIGDVCKTDLSFSEKLEIIENKLELFD